VVDMMTTPRGPFERFFVPQHVVELSQPLLAEPGLEGYEAVVVWVGRIRGDKSVEIVEVIRPAQIAKRSSIGCSVEIPPDALTDLIRVLEERCFITARLHTHPTEAYHSELDDTNMLISHVGAISIVVPFFARDPLVLERCSVNELTRDNGWVELPVDEVRERFRVHD